MKLTRRFDSALLLALELHADQKTKGKQVPYAAHLLSTAALVMQFGGTERQAIAALLHDAAEDAGGRPTLARIRRLFGGQVARIVADCSDTFDRPKPEWEKRKRLYIESVATKPAASLLVTACDKLDNARTIVADLRREGPRTLDKFRGGRRTLWYYDQMAKALGQAGAGTPVTNVVWELRVAVREMKRLAGPDRRRGARAG